MALVTLVLQDQADGDVDVRVFSEPKLELSSSHPTKAQSTLLVALNAIQAAAEETTPKRLSLPLIHIPH